jgi:hypothetical protein
MSAKVFEQHPTHYLQKSHVHLLELCATWFWAYKYND